MIKSLLDVITAHGDRGAVVPVSRFDDLRRDMEDLRSGDRHDWSDYTASMMTLPDVPDFTPRSLISVITPSPMSTMYFMHRGERVRCIAPPTYAEEEATGEAVLRYLCAYLEPLGYKTAPVDYIPKKAFAVRSGLGRYGRSNICYSEDFGSFMSILAFVSDVPCEDDTWHQLRQMDACATCTACLDACPTGAIDAEHTVIDAYRCLTKLNEFPEDFPDWLDKSAHNCVIGCMKCQSCCPHNAKNTDNIAEGAEFDEQETAEILSHTGDGQYSEPLEAKMRAAGFSPPFWKMLPRNLAALLEAVEIQA